MTDVPVLHPEMNPEGGGRERKSKCACVRACVTPFHELPSITEDSVAISILLTVRSLSFAPPEHY